MVAGTPLKYQVSIFGDFSKYGATEDNLRKCFESLFKFQMLPNQIQELNQVTGQSENRISLQSISSGIMIHLLSDRMDILAMPLPGNPAAKLDVSSFVASGLPVAGELLQMFPVAITRVGFVVENFMAEIPAAKMEGVRSNFLGEKLNFAKGLPTIEWNVRDVVTGELGGVPSNFIFAISRVKAQVSDARGFRETDTHHLLVDINSTPGASVSFKDISGVQSYVSKAIGMYEQMKVEIEGRVNA